MFASFDDLFHIVDSLCRRRDVASAQDLYLRARCLSALGDPDSADRDLMAAFVIDGADLEIALAVLQAHHGDDVARTVSRAVAAHPHASRRQKGAALSSLARADGTAMVVTRHRGGLRGLVSWSGPIAPSVLVASRAVPVTPLSTWPRGEDGVATFDAAWPEDLPASVTCLSGAGADQTVALSPIRSLHPSPAPTLSDRVRVVVPVFAGRAVTQDCLEALAAQETDRPIDVAVVDDASPDQDLARFVRAFSADRGWTCIRNDRNLGFAASVNRGVQASTARHLLLLNADAILPPAGIDRLLAAAAHQGVGTVVPFSNDGGFTSFPRLHQHNRMPSTLEADAIDAAARSRNRGRVVDIPSGTAFCMLVSRPCWDAVGGLDLGYGRGYFEDVDFCLRAKRRGFRNVVATDVFVRHQGGQSFGSDKRVLVAQNAAVVQERFPAYDADAGSFLEADPLRVHRARIESAVVPRGRFTVLVGRPANCGPVMMPRQHEAERDGSRPLVLAWTRAGEATLRAGDGEMPQSLRFPQPRAARLAGYLAALDIGSIEYCEPDLVPLWLRPVLAGLGAPASVIVGSRASARFVQTAEADWLCGAKTVPVDAMARAALAGRQRREGPVRQPDAGTAAAGLGAVRIAALAPVATRTADRLVGALDRALQRHGGEVVTFGPGLRAMRSRPKATGRMAPGEYPAALRHRRITHVLLPDADAPYGLVEELRRVSRLPAAFFDWSDGRLPVADGDLALPDRTDLAEAVRAILAWCAAEPGPVLARASSVAT